VFTNDSLTCVDLKYVILLKGSFLDQDKKKSASMDVKLGRRGYDENVEVFNDVGFFYFFDTNAYSCEIYYL